MKLPVRAQIKLKNKTVQSKSPTKVNNLPKIIFNDQKESKLALYKDIRLKIIMCLAKIKTKFAQTIKTNAIRKTSPFQSSNQESPSHLNNIQAL